MISDKIDVLLLSEAKIEKKFFWFRKRHIPGFAKPIRLDWNSLGGGIMLLIFILGC